MTPTLNPEKRFEQLCDKATRLIATGIMGWTIQEVENHLDGIPRYAYFKGEERLGLTHEYAFHPAQSIQDAFWVMDTLTATRNVRFEIDYDPKCDCIVRSKRLMKNVAGSGTKLPIATVQMALYVMAEDHPANSDAQERLFALSTQLLELDEATAKPAEYTGDGLFIDLAQYQPV